MGNSWLIRVAKRSVYFRRIHVNLGFFRVKTGVLSSIYRGKILFFRFFIGFIRKKYMYTVVLFGANYLYIK